INVYRQELLDAMVVPVEAKHLAEAKSKGGAAIFQGTFVNDSLRVGLAVTPEFRERFAQGDMEADTLVFQRLRSILTSYLNNKLRGFELHEISAQLLTDVALHQFTGLAEVAPAPNIPAKRSTLPAEKVQEILTAFFLALGESHGVSPSLVEISHQLGISLEE